MTISTQQAGPFLKWVGGKGQLLSQFAPLFPQAYECYFEPFVGGGAVFFHLQPAQAILSDSNPNLIAAYRHVQVCIDELISYLYEIQAHYHRLSSLEQEQAYYQARSEYNALPIDTVKKTALLIFMNKTGYNGLYRESKRGGYNVPFGRYDNPALFDETNLRVASKVLQGVELVNMPFSEVLQRAKTHDFVYFDPPYVPISKTASFTSYTKMEFGREQQAQLADTARQLALQGVQVMISNSNNDLIRKLYNDFHIHEVQASRMVNSKAAQRGKITELVITSY